MGNPNNNGKRAGAPPLTTPIKASEDIVARVVVTVDKQGGYAREYTKGNLPPGAAPALPGSGDGREVIGAGTASAATGDPCCWRTAARGYGQLAGGWGDPSKPEALRAYFQVFGVEIQGAPGRVEKGWGLVKQWLKAALLTKGASGLSLPAMPETAVSGDAGLQGARAGDGATSFAGCAPVLLYRLAGGMTLS